MSHHSSKESLGEFFLGGLGWIAVFIFALLCLLGWHSPEATPSNLGNSHLMEYPDGAK